MFLSAELEPRLIITACVCEVHAETTGDFVIWAGTQLLLHRCLATGKCGTFKLTGLPRITHGSDHSTVIDPSNPRWSAI